MKRDNYSPVVFSFPGKLLDKKNHRVSALQLRQQEPKISPKIAERKKRGMDRQLTLEILLYLNIYYFGLYAGMEALFLFIKFFHLEAHSK
jgi:hypothetical protein